MADTEHPGLRLIEARCRLRRADLAIMTAEAQTSITEPWAGSEKARAAYAELTSAARELAAAQEAFNAYGEAQRVRMNLPPGAAPGTVDGAMTDAPARFRAVTYCMMSADDIRDNWPGTTAVFCGEPPVGTITFACIHEHLNKTAACATCAAEIQRCAPDLICPRCEDGPEPHECVCSVVIDWDSGEKTIVQEVARA